MSQVSETEARQETVCRGCGKEKSVGCVVCWTCFKHRTDITPLKYYEGTLQQWLDWIKSREL